MWCISIQKVLPFPEPVAGATAVKNALAIFQFVLPMLDLLLRLCPDDEDTIYQIVDLLVDTCATNRKLLRIAGDDKPAEVVRSRFMKLNFLRQRQKRLLPKKRPLKNQKKLKQNLY